MCVCRHLYVNHLSQAKYVTKCLNKKNHTYDADTSSSCFSASSRFIDSNSTFSSMFYEEKKQHTFRKSNTSGTRHLVCSDSWTLTKDLKYNLTVYILRNVFYIMIEYIILGLFLQKFKTQMVLRQCPIIHTSIKILKIKWLSRDQLI